jgi:HAE1 family hydrophobic/amphiphilic exporter-1
MDLIRIAIDRPIAVISAVLMAVLFGALALSRIPIQLIPDVAKPVIEVETIWAGAAPAEIEREIVNRQEEQLRGLEGLDTMVSRSETGRARVNLEFAIGTNMDRALLLVSNRLDRVSGYPDEASAPTLDTSGSDDNPITWITLRRDPGNTREMSHYGDFANDVVKERIERVEGVALVNYVRRRRARVADHRRAGEPREVPSDDPRPCARAPDSEHFGVGRRCR